MNENLETRKEERRYLDPLFSFVSDCLDDINGSGFARCDVKSDKDNYLLEIDLPGVEKKDITIKLENGYLSIKGSRIKTIEDNTNYIHKERYFGEFNRTYYLGDGTTKEDITATMENGVLTVKINKALERKEKESVIDIH